VGLALGLEGRELRALAGPRRDTAVQAGRRLEDDEWAPEDLDRDERRVETRRFLLANTGVNLNPVRPQRGLAFSADPLVRILERAHHSRDPRLDDPVRAGPGAPDMTARLERYVHRRPTCRGAGAFERVDLGVRFARSLVPPLPDHDTISRDHHRAHHRIRRGAALPACRVEQGTSHVSFVDGPAGYHFSWNSALT
jgi:hypothetical protein